MTTPSDPGRHAPVGVIEDYLVQGPEGVLGIRVADRASADQPASSNPRSPVPAGVRAPNVVEFENLEFDVISDNQVVWHQLAVRLDDNLDEVYALLCAILDRVQLSGEPFANAVEEALDSLTGILAVRRHLSERSRLACSGNSVHFWPLRRREDATPPWSRGVVLSVRNMTSGCRSRRRGEDDTGERREHWISTTTQLVPTGDRPLYLLSIQLTAAALDSGNTLPGLVASARSKLATHVVRLEAVLARLGYRDRDSDLYHSRWTLRTLLRSTRWAHISRL